MSHVLDFIITASILEEEDDDSYFDPCSPQNSYGHRRMRELKIALDLPLSGLEPLPAHRVDQHNGGNAAMQNKVYAGALKDVGIEELRQAILKINWVSPDEVRVFICDEGWSAYEPLFLGKPYTRDQTMFEDEIEGELLSE